MERFGAAEVLWFASTWKETGHILLSSIAKQLKKVPLRLGAHLIIGMGKGLSYDSEE